MTDEGLPANALAEAVGRGMNLQSSKLQGLAATMESVGGILAVFAIVGGLVLALQTDTTGTFDTTRPFLGVGVGLVVGGVVQGLLVVALARTMGLFATYVQWQSALAGTAPDLTAQIESAAPSAAAEFGQQVSDPPIAAENPSAAGFVAGWYSDPYREPGETTLRWWDGERWTRNVRER